jgi:hypothetical protein
MICGACLPLEAAQKGARMITTRPSGRNAAHHSGDFLGATHGIGLVRASTITRMTGSVPEGRNTTRPSSPSARTPF